VAGRSDGVCLALARGRSADPDRSARRSVHVPGGGSEELGRRRDGVRDGEAHVRPREPGAARSATSADDLHSRLDVLVVRRATPRARSGCSSPRWVPDVTFAVRDTTFRAHASILASAARAQGGRARSARGGTSSWTAREAVTPEAYTDHLEPTDERVGDLAFATDKYEMDTGLVLDFYRIFYGINLYRNLFIYCYQIKLKTHTSCVQKIP
jgi:hypothetical protein